MKRAKTGGRKAGTPNKATASVKAALEEAFEKLGGVQALVDWAAENPGEFFKLWAKLLPREITMEHRGMTLEELIGLSYEEIPETQLPHKSVGLGLNRKTT